VANEEKESKVEGSGSDCEIGVDPLGIEESFGEIMN
jgi:hypothetical protein